MRRRTRRLTSLVGGLALLAAGTQTVLAPRPSQAAVSRAASSADVGYWVATETGDVAAFGDAARAASVSPTPNRPVVGMAATSSSGGYWLVASDGGIFAFGDAIFLGSTGAVRLNRPIVGMAATPSGSGYWLVASDGGIFAFGDARFFGSTGAMRLNKPIVGMASTPSGDGYWLVASDGGIFSFGDAAFLGSTGAVPLNRPIVGMAATPSGSGYWLVASDGGIFNFGDAAFLGSFASRRTSAVAMSTSAAAPVSQDSVTEPPPGPDPTTTTTEAPASPFVPPAAAPGPFRVAFLGDTGDDYERTLRRVRDAMAELPLALVVHDGDYLVQGQPCTSDRMREVYGVFDSFAQPFVYTPGDNEWLNCEEPDEELAEIRQVFFATDHSLGQQPITLERHPTYVENARWTMGGVVFATFNVPGPDGSGGRNASARNQANVEWLHATFDAAESAGAPGVVLVTQDNPFAGGFPKGLLAAIRQRTTAFGGPVALVNGDTHNYSVDHPWEDLPNFTRAETWGPGDAKYWVELTVDPADPDLFSFTSDKA